MKTILFTFIILLFCGYAISAPAITDLTNNLTTINIVGTGFGTKATAAPLKFDNFEDPARSDGDNVTEGGFWTTSSTTATYNNTVQRASGSTLNLRNRFIEGTSTNPVERDNTGFIDTLKTYINMWVYIDYVNVSGGGNEQLKLWRLHESTVYASRPLLAHQIHITPPTTTFSSYTEFWREDGTFNSSPSFSASDWPEGRWINIELEYRDSSVDVADGIYTLWHNRASGAILEFPDDALVTRTNVDAMDCLSIGYTVVGLDVGAEIITYWDDVYIDNSWARVVIGDNADYDLCTDREIQIPSAWSDTSITATVNQGAFSEGVTYYLFVTDESGDVNTTGAPITFGAGDQSSTIGPGTSSTFSAGDSTVIN